MGEAKGRAGARRAWSARLLLLGAVVVAGCDGQCGDCNPSFQGCSLTPTAGTPPGSSAVAPPTIQCASAVSPGNNITLSATLSGGTPPWRYTVAWGDGVTEDGRSGAAGQASTVVRVLHTYASAGPRHDVRITFTATDDGGRAQTCSDTFTVSTAP